MIHIAANLFNKAFGFYKKESGFPPREQWRALLGSSVILALHWLVFFASVQSAGVAIATLTFAAFPLFSVLIDALPQQRRPHGAEMIAGLTIVLAVGLLVHPQSGKGNFLGITAGLASAVTFAWFGHASKHLGQTLSPLRISLAQNAVVAVVLTPFLFFVSGSPSVLMDWVWLLLLGVVTTALMHQLYFYAMQRLSASTCSGFVALEPVYAILFAAALFREPITPWVALSALLIIGASLTLL